MRHTRETRREASRVGGTPAKASSCKSGSMPCGGLGGGGGKSPDTYLRHWVSLVSMKPFVPLSVITQLDWLAAESTIYQ